MLTHKLYAEYQKANPERFNKEFIYGSRTDDILPYVRDIFKSLEILEEFEVLDVSIDTDESQFGPIKQEKKLYKGILKTRLEKIHYRIKVTPTEISEDRKIMDDGVSERKKLQSPDSFIIERDLYVNKLVDGMFFINEDSRYFLVHQLVDSSVYGNKNSLSLKSLLMPITVSRASETGITVSTVDGKETYSGFPSYQVLLFAKKINPLLYVFAKNAYNYYVDHKDELDSIADLQTLKYPEITNKVNEFFGTSYKFSDDPSKLVEEGRSVFQISEGAYMSVETKKLKEREENTLSTFGSFFNIRGAEKRKKNIMKFDDMEHPIFWINLLSSFFTKNTEQSKKIEKAKTMLISLSRLVDGPTKKILRLPDSDKENSLAIIRYIMRNFETLIKEDNCDFASKRLRLYEYVVNPLRMYLSDQIYRILNSPTRSKVVLEKTFSNLKPFYLVRQTVVSELLRYYNATNETDLYTCLLTYTQTGPQAIGKVSSIESRDVHPSHVGKVSLVASNASNPGLSGRLVPFVQVYEHGHFAP